MDCCNFVIVCLPTSNHFWVCSVEHVHVSYRATTLLLLDNSIENRACSFSSLARWVTLLTSYFGDLELEGTLHYIVSVEVSEWVHQRPSTSGFTWDHVKLLCLDLQGREPVMTSPDQQLSVIHSYKQRAGLGAWLTDNACVNPTPRTSKKNLKMKMSRERAIILSWVLPWL